MTHRTASMAAPTASALALLGIQLLLGAEAGAADLNARDFFGAPAGTTLGVLYLPATRAHEFHGPPIATAVGRTEDQRDGLTARCSSATSAALSARRSSSFPSSTSMRACPAAPGIPARPVSAIPRSAAPCSSSTTGTAPLQRPVDPDHPAAGRVPREEPRCPARRQPLGATSFTTTPRHRPRPGAGSQPGSAVLREERRLLRQRPGTETALSPASLRLLRLQPEHLRRPRWCTPMAAN